MAARVSNLMVADRMLRSIQKGLYDLARTHEQFSSGRIFDEPMQSPTGFMSALRLREVLSSQRTFLSNVETGVSNLQYIDTSLQSVNDAIIRSQELALTGANSPSADAGRVGLAEEVRQILDQTFTTANSKYSDRYLFSGSKVDQAPFVRELDEDGNDYVAYRGDQTVRYLEVDHGILVPDNVNGIEAFFGAIGQVRSTVSVADPTALLAASLPGAPPPSNGDFTGTFDVNGKTITVEATDTLETLRDKINEADADVIASIDDQNRLIFRSNRSIQTHLEQGTSNVLQGLGMLRTVEGGPVGAGITDLTPLAALGVATPEALRMKVGAQTLDLDLSTAATVGDVLNIINGSGLNVNAYINSDGTGMNVTSLDSKNDVEITDVRRVFGADLGVAISSSTTLASLGIAPSAIEIQNDSLTYQVDLSSATTIGGILEFINNAPNNGGVRAAINANGTGIDIISPYVSGSLEVREVGAGTSAADLGILGLRNQTTAMGLGLKAESQLDEVKPVNLFQSLIELEDLLRQGDKETQVMTKHTELQSELDALLTVRSRSGSRINGMENIKSKFQDREVFLTELISSNEDAEMTEVIVHLQTRQNSLEAALSSGSRILQTSLLNFLG